MDIQASRKDKQIDALMDAVEGVVQEYELKAGVELEVKSVDIVKLSDQDQDTSRRDAQLKTPVLHPILK